MTVRSTEPISEPWRAWITDPVRIALIESGRVRPPARPYDATIFSRLPAPDVTPSGAPTAATLLDWARGGGGDAP